jgi:predicted dehydrogenase
VLRIGIVGAGRVVRHRHLPGLRALGGVSVVGVANRRRESSVRVAHEEGIPRAYETWEHLIDDTSIDAIVIGTWPYMHGPITLAALDAGKHVLCQSRMAMNAREAQRMLDKARERPRQVAMVAPSPYGLAGDATMRRLIDSGFLGRELRELHVTSFSARLADRATPLGWRQVARYSGFNMLDLGALHETALRWTSPPVRVMALASKSISRRFDPETGQKPRVGTADGVHVLTSHEDGSTGVYRHSAVHWHEPQLSIRLVGSYGTLVYDLLRDEIRGARGGADAVSTNGDAPRGHLPDLPIPLHEQGGWTVEADFVAAIRDGKPVTRTDFVTGVRTMQFTEAVARSSRHLEAVELPLKEFSNPSL